jgi:hypothetical protein
MSTIYKADPDVVDLMKSVVAEHHPDLALVVDEIAVVFKEKGGETNGRPNLGKAQKANPLFGVLGDTDYKFILTLAADHWLELTGRQRKALLMHLLCACRADEVDGEYKYSVAPPDVSFYWDELDVFGDWRPRPEGDGPSGPSPVEEVFGKKAGAESQSVEEEEDLLGGLVS